ncbi:hypothetical protein FZC84_13060 [Rossellomorea vietnamensis]|uniref:Peptidase M14 domain-containing protein n=1 Tax=Rossellomorea vietnamensis TaxID=218284 RepID=A0A5D4MBY4_9BACI|nr:M14 family zinc carboxypeptidase [Rossellomorea vietnamensis]TYR98947.1 hypothetical protein FZC84_13060 [Rossellomorea vietnamensis]
MVNSFRRILCVLLSIFLLLPALNISAQTAEEKETLMRVSDSTTVVTGEGKKMELSPGAQFYGERNEDGSFRVEFNGDYFELSANEAEEEVLNEEQPAFVDEAALSQQLFPEGTVLSLMEGEQAITLLSDMMLSVNEEQTHAVIGNSSYLLEVPENTDPDPAMEESEQEVEESEPAIKESEQEIEESEPAIEEEEQETTAPAEPAYSFSEHKTFSTVSEHLSFYKKTKEGELVKQGELMPGVSYQLIREYGNWLEFQYGEQKAFVWKAAVEPVSQKELDELKAPEGQGTSFSINEDVTVYEQSAKSLTPIAHLLKGTKGEYHSVQGEWLEVHFAGRQGLIKKEAVDVASITAAAEPSSDYIKILLTNTSFYSNEGGSLTKLGQLQKGETYRKIRELGNWYEVSVGGKNAFILKEAAEPSQPGSVPYISDPDLQDLELISNATAYDNSTGSLVDIGFLLKGQKLNYISKAGNWYVIELLGRKAYIHGSAVTLDFNPLVNYFEVNQENVAVVVNNGGTLETRGYVEKGERYKRIGDAGNWHIIDVAGTKMYVWKKATLPVGAPANISDQASGSRTLTLELDATVYDNSTGGLVPISMLQKNQSYNYISKAGNWYKVIVAGRTGYIHKDAVKLEFEEEDDYFEVVQDNVSVVKNQGGKLIDVGRLVKGQVYKRIKDYGNWHLVDFGKVQGFVWEDATSPFRGSELPTLSGNGPESVYFTAKEDLGVYDNSSGELVNIGEIKAGSQFGVISQMGNWYEINFSGRKAYIYSPATELNASRVVNARERVYTYEEMVNDLQEIARMYPSFTQLTTIGKSVDGRDIYAIKLGKGSKEVLVDASTHAREHMTTNIVMTMLDNYAYSYATNQYFEGMNVPKILNETSIWFVPMVNPDGVTLVQKGHTSAKNPQEVLRMNNLSTNFTSWKANIRGVDINRQFPADWDNITNNSGRPSNKNYKGKAPLTEPEAQAVANFILSRDFKAFASYHSSGEILYWHFNQTNHYARDYALARKIGNITGYSLVSPLYDSSGSGASQDWFIRQVGKPGFTVEISPYVVEREVPLYYYDRIWNQNKIIGLVVADEAKYY